jgi:XTP/dITP diphosphohydrolase
MKIVVGTGNKGKLREIMNALGSLGPDTSKIEVLSLADFPGLVMPPETGATFAENALIKARAVSEATGLVALSDDSGLEVDFLGNAPGVHSARYAALGNGTEQNATDDDNIDKLLGELEGVKEEHRGARFRCVIAIVAPKADGVGPKVEATFSGTLEGRITTARVGSNGFGYDPVFFIPALGRTAAECTVEAKRAVSHRGAALKKLALWLGESGLL